MDAAKGRRQTTQGIWVGLSGTKEKNIIVFDVEGIVTASFSIRYSY